MWGDSDVCNARTETTEAPGRLQSIRLQFNRIICHKTVPDLAHSMAASQPCAVPLLGFGLGFGVGLALVIWLSCGQALQKGAD